MIEVSCCSILIDISALIKAIYMYHAIGSVRMARRGFVCGGLLACSSLPENFTRPCYLLG